MSIEAMTRALEALEQNKKLIHGSNSIIGLVGAMDGYYSSAFSRQIQHTDDITETAITALRQAIEAYAKTDKTDGVLHKEWVGLEIHEIREVRFKSGKRNSVIEFAKAIEAKLKEKNT
jgi:hypothetical protein